MRRIDAAAAEEIEVWRDGLLSDPAAELRPRQDPLELFEQRVGDDEIELAGAPSL